MFTIRIQRYTAGFLIGMAWFATSFTASAGIRPLPQLEGHPSVPLRVQTFAREQEIVTNPIRWSQFTYRVPEGTWVEEGDVMFEFDMSIPEDRMKGILNRLAETENNVAVRLGRIREQLIDLQDQKAQLKDQWAVQEARLNYLRVLPREEDVAIARGRLEVAKRNLEAAQLERETAKTRLERNLIAPVILEQAQTALDLQKARTEYAQKRLDFIKHPAHPNDLRIVELRMANLELEIEKLVGEITSREEILRIETRSTDRQLEEIHREKSEIEEELQHTRLLAPRAGVVIYTGRLKRELASGGKPPKGMALAELPDPKSMALRGRIPEELRSIFRPGDPVSVVLNPMPDVELRGHLHSVSPLPRDLAEGSGRGDGDEETGVKVYDVVILLDEPPENVPFGVYGQARIRTRAPIKGPAVPLSWTRMRDGSHHLSVNGTFRSVDGHPVGAYFILQDEEVNIADLSPDGNWPARQNEEDLLDTDRMAASGQLQPLESIAVNVPAIRSWDMRVTSLKPEDTQVEKGDILAELDSERINNQVNDASAEVTRRTGIRESAEEDLALRRREGTFQLARARNLLEIRKLEHEGVEAGISSAQLHQATLDKETAEIQLAAARRDLVRIENAPELTAPPERRRKERDVRRRELQLEQAQLQLAQAQKGATPVERSLARLQLARQEAELASLESSTSRRISQAESTVRRRIRQERWRINRYNDLIESQKSLVIRAPASGLVKYENLWDGVGEAKLRVGMGVFSRSHLMSLSDSSRMVVRVSVPERHISRLKQGMSVQVRIPSEGTRIWQGEIVKIEGILVPADSPSLRGSLYANIEPPLEHVIGVEVLLRDSEHADLKPGAIAHVVFPFSR
ncbi:MAG: HlyD family efflux transporter periplasmic adaptor subunit [Verrucomicrobia bacterium]|nr:HlyD family efflux transporter periplasmic adaptor subunit [Verrucomicrobiota bacterium]MCH8513344.1 efflux RND transporter periplasmic adaptor subunit [Kiritimatiellia bacterium]